MLEDAKMRRRRCIGSMDSTPRGYCLTLRQWCAAAFVLLGVVGCGGPAASPPTPNSAPTGSGVSSSAPTLGANAHETLTFVRHNGLYRQTNGHRPRKIAHVGDADSLESLVVVGKRVYWTVSPQGDGRMSIMSYSTRTRRRGTLLRFRGGSGDLIAARGHLFWGGASAIGKVSLDGSNVHRRFIHLPQAGGGHEVEDGLTSDGRYLYISQCTKDRLGRVPNEKSIHPRVHWLLRTACPQELSWSNGYLFWSSLNFTSGGRIGRVTDTGNNPDPTWLKIASIQGPFSIDANSKNIYWSWGSGSPGASFIGRAPLAKPAQKNRKYLSGSGPISVRTSTMASA
jgi:hypothetical protein